jgi:hypothetical protein
MIRITVQGARRGAVGDTYAVARTEIVPDERAR